MKKGLKKGRIGPRGGRREATPGVTLVELQVAAVVVAILFFMIAGIAYFFINGTMPFVNREGFGLAAASVFDHMERNITQGNGWVNAPGDPVTDMTINIPPDRPSGQDREVLYRFDNTIGNSKVSFFPDPNDPSTERILVRNIENYYINTNGPLVYIELTMPSPDLTFRRGGITLSRTIRRRS